MLTYTSQPTTSRRVLVESDLSGRVRGMKITRNASDQVSEVGLSCYLFIDLTSVGNERIDDLCALAISCRYAVFDLGEYFADAVKQAVADIAVQNSHALFIV